MSDSQLHYEQRGHIALITLNNPDKLNALSGPMRDGMQDMLKEAHADDGIRALVITGAGKGFCSGVQLAGGSTPGSAPVEEQVPAQNALLDEFGWVGRQALSIYRLDKPVVAAVNGVAAGAGMSLATACDLRVGSERSRFRAVFIERNLSPDSGLSFFLPRIVGYSRAADLILTSRDVDADEASRIGLLDRLVEHEALVETALALADQMAQWPPLALRTSKRVLQHNIEVDLEAALKYEYQSLSYGRKARNDARESRLAFVEKRKPNYTGT
jgi:2-(1,2-epoxy-1,2-dihydrophenyl)acetyl-CoA isomerase